METHPGRLLVRDLMFEYIKQNKLLVCEKDEIPNKINEIVEVQNIINDAVLKKFQKFKFL